MVLACGKKDEYRMARRVMIAEVSGGAGTRKTEVTRDGWCEGGLGQQRNEGGDCASMLKKSERLESPSTYIYVTELVSRGHICLALCSFGQPFRALVVITWSVGGGPLHDAVGIICKKSSTTEYQLADVKYLG